MTLRHSYTYAPSPILEYRIIFLARSASRGSSAAVSQSISSGFGLDLNIGLPEFIDEVV